MDGATRYTVDMGWGLMLGNLGIKPADLLRQARLPLDLFQRKTAQVTSAEYFRLWSAIETVSGDPLVPIRLVGEMTAETFSPALFACLCSETLDAALMRLSHFKPLVGPMRLQITKGPTETVAEIAGLPADAQPPAIMLAGELAFLTQLARLGLRDRIAPTWVEGPAIFPDPGAYAQWFGCRPRPGETTRIAFHRRDSERPFLTAHPAMWAAFEPSLRQRLSDATTVTSTSARVSGWLTETIASGRTSIDDAARGLSVSTRTLQRRLTDEGTSFQMLLAETRLKLSRHYLTQTHLSTPEIAFLLGYSEQNSFYRSFRDWTGLTPEEARHSPTATFA
ncbi:AraC-type DNA-binding protein [Kaistia soli DSM 19436]|uniref:AraC-type DNA-binding protein n=1 Tax=Kaistia soli DSM 19436 TaxID=1122133 RepID=A0A1M5DYF8_9HYPH|nr:AraC family transcriptional regulator [Kaistia soli]SHF71871.1 AraC-type DNA-binding protein [Kaistia soli DSM 19436]